MKASCGDTVKLDASGTYDPEGDAMIYRWWVMPEAGTYEGNVDVSGSDSPVAGIYVPDDASGRSVHVIFEVCDDGVPSLTSYRRIVLNIK